MSDLISREDAIKAVAIAALDDRDELEALKAIPSAEAVSMEEHIKELNDLAVEWKTKFAKAEKITDEIYDETMAKVAKECEECKERLRNIRPSAEAENESCGTCKYFETSHREYPCSDCTVGNSHYVSAEAVQGAWVRKYDDKVNCYWYECDQCGEYRPRNQFGHEYNANFCPNCGARMKGGGTE